MRKVVGRLGTGVLELLLPSAQAQACMPSYCQLKNGRVRCCKVCPNGTYCTGWVPGKTCVGVTCPN